MKKVRNLLLVLLAAVLCLLLLTGCAPAAQSPAPAETQQTAEPQAAAAEEPTAPEQSAEQQPEQSDTITVTDHNDNVVTVPRRIDRIVVCDILPLPSVLSVFFDSAEKLVGIAPSSMSAAQNSLLSQLYPEILNAEIAEALHLSEATVKNHLKRIFDKLGLDGGARGKRMLLADVLPKISP